MQKTHSCRPAPPPAPSPANQGGCQAILTFGMLLVDGDRVFLRWRDSDNGGFDAGLAIGSFRVTPVPEVSAAALAAAGIAIGLRRRRTVAAPV